MEKINVFWFRRDLRLEDNTALFYALSEAIPVVPIFIFDTNILDALEDKKDARLEFIHDRLSGISQRLSENGSGMHFFHCKPIEAYEQLLREYEIENVFTNRDYEPYAKERDAEVSELLKSHGARLLTFKDQVIFEHEEILNDQGAPYKVFTPYKKRWLEAYDRSQKEQFPSEKLIDHFLQKDFEAIPTLTDLGFEPTDIEIPKLELDTDLLSVYAEKRDFPAVKGTSKQGIHLRFGTLSIRKAVKVAAKTSEVWLSELIWREFYMMILSNFPEVQQNAFKKQYDRIPWDNNEEHFQKWCDGKTGYPIVDAGMRELNATGYMHNRVRMVVASFLTKHLLIDWRWGEAYFAQKLLDFELASNNGGWQWAAGTGTDAQPYFRVFNPESQQKKFDPNMKYILKWVPEFGTSKYPKPIVEHKFARERAISTYKEAVSQ